MKSQNAFLVLIGLLVIYGVSTSLNQVDKSFETAEQIANPTRVLPHELRKAYMENSAAADQQYTGQLLELQGTVNGVSKGLGSGYVVGVWSKAPGETTSWRIDCYFDADSQSEVSQLSKGQTVIVRGRLEAGVFSSSLGPSLKDSVIVK